MVTISNVKVYDLEESVVACRNAMRMEPVGEVTKEEWEKDLARAKALAKAPTGSGNCTFLSGIRVSFDIIYPNYFSPELQRYHWIDIVTSSSKMHRLAWMDMDKAFNEYVDQESKDHMKALVNEYRRVNEEGCDEDVIYKARMRLLSNCPQGLQLFMRVSTNYLQLRTIYTQRRNHRLKEDWGAFCDFIKNLPYADDFIINPVDNMAENLKKVPLNMYKTVGM